jgi:hypothetical protein
MEHKELCVDELIAKFEEITSSAGASKAAFRALCIVGKPHETEVAVRADMGKYAALIYSAGIKRKPTAAKQTETADVAEINDIRKEDLVYANNF